MKHPKNIAIIGAGPTGLIAAEILAGAGHAVTIYDRMPSPGRKFLMAGRGGLNLTHSEPLDTFLTRYGDASDWLAPSIRAFPPQALRDWCESLGEETFIGSSGRIFPRKMKAAPLLRAWLKRLESLGVQYAPNHTWQGTEENTLLFQHQNEMIRVTPDATLLALGGASWPRLGSDGSWTNILANWGTPLTPLAPANCGFIVQWSDYFRTRHAGTPLKPVTITHNGVSRQGEAMITANGIEGGAIYALSASIRKTIEHTGRAEITLDLRPDMTIESLTHKLETRGNKSLSTYLRGAKFSPAATSLLHETTKPVDLTPQALATRLKSIPITLTGTTGIDRAISTAGGIRCEALTEHFMLKAKPGVFAAGEMLEWEAPTGGYLLQGCFSTGVAAAKGMFEFLLT